MIKLKYFGLLFLFPLVVGMQGENPDSSETNLKLAGGAGSYAYVSRGCEGQVLNKQRIPYGDLGFSIDHKPKSPFRIGFRGGFIREPIRSSWEPAYSPDKRATNFYFNPDFAFEWEYFGIGAGFFSSQKDLYWRDLGTARNFPSGHLRIGNPRFYFSAHLMESVPLYSGGGYLDLGVGGKASRKVSYWLGLSIIGPYDTNGFLIKTDFEFAKNWQLNLAGRLGRSQGISENAVSLGLSYRIITK